MKKLTYVPYRQSIRAQKLVEASFVAGHMTLKRKLARFTFTEAVEAQKICSTLNFPV
jgi:hypothetical protein